MKTYRTDPSRWQRFVSGISMFAVACLTALSFSGCGDSSDSSSLTPSLPPVTVAAPGAPTALTVTGGENLATLQWSPPAASATAGLPDSYEIYGSTTATTAATIVAPANLVKTIPVVSGQAVYSHTALGLAGGNTYSFVVTAKNTGGETPSTVASAQVTVPVVAPGKPTAFTATGGENVATLQWSPPAASATAGLPVTYEIYGSTTATTAATLVDPANFVASVAVVSGQTVYSYTALGLAGGNAKHNFVVTAKNTGGETPSHCGNRDRYRASRRQNLWQQLFSGPGLCGRYRHHQPGPRFGRKLDRRDRRRDDDRLQHRNASAARRSDRNAGPHGPPDHAAVFDCYLQDGSFVLRAEVHQHLAG